MTILVLCIAPTIYTMEPNDEDPDRKGRTANKIFVYTIFIFSISL